MPTFTKIDFHFIAVSRSLSSTLFRTTCENNNFELLAPVLEGWKGSKNHNVPQYSIKIQILFCGSYDPKWVPDRSFESYTQFWWSGRNEKNHEVAKDTLLYRLYKPPDFGSHPLKKFMIFEFYIPISNYRIYLVYLVQAFLWFSLYCYAWTIAVFTTNSSIETGQQSDKKKSQKISQTVKRCRMHPPAMPPNFKKNRSLLHEIHVLEILTPRYANTCFVKVGPFDCIGSHMCNTTLQLHNMGFRSGYIQWCCYQCHNIIVHSTEYVKNFLHHQIFYMAWKILYSTKIFFLFFRQTIFFSTWLFILLFPLRKS